ncbi:MAG TPA: phosphatidylglycerol lysyltransferase domain-containing protein [Ruminiclostridium sp.]
MLQTVLRVSEISIYDKECFDKYFKMANLQVSELNFTNFFMWRDHYKIRFSIVNDFLCIISVMEDNKSFCFFPIGDYNNGEDLKNAILMLREYFSQMGWEFMFSRVSEYQISILEGLDIKFVANEDRDNFDYIYSVKSLSTLAGKKLDGKRNHINKFKKLYTYEYEEISDENISDCKAMIEKWCLQRNYLEHSNLISERKANLDLLDNFNSLGIKGAIIKVNGEPEAFTVGQKLNSDTVVIHIEKANSEIHGLYPLINQQFLSNQWCDMEYVNREQDLGVEGLRKAKLSYSPISFVEKFTVQLC